MAENEITSSVDLNLELDRLVTTSLEKSLQAQLRQLKLPAAFIKQELGIELDPRLDQAKVRQRLEKIRNELTTATEQALSQGTKQATVRLPTSSGKIKEFQASAEQLASLRKVIDEQLSFVSQSLHDFSSGKVGKLVADLRSGKRQRSDLNEAELAELERFSTYLGELGQQTSSIARASRQIGKKVTQQVSQNEYASLDRIPLILENFARIGQRLGAISKSLPRVVDNLAAAEKALEQQTARATVIRSQAQTYVRPPEEQRTFVKGLQDSELDAGRRSIQERLRQLGDAQARGVPLTAFEDQEFSQLRTAGQFVKREQGIRQRAATGYYDQDTDVARAKAEAAQAKAEAKAAEAAARREQADAARQARTEEQARVRRQQEIEKAFQQRTEALRFADAAVGKAGASPLRDLTGPDREAIRAQLVREASSLRNIQRGQGDTGVDPVITGKLGEIRAYLNQIAALKDQERKLAAEQLASQRADVRFQSRQITSAAVGSNALQAVRGVPGGDFNLLSQADRAAMAREVKAAITQLERFRKGVADGSELADQSKRNVQELQAAAAKLSAATRAFKTAGDLEQQLAHLEQSRTGLQRSALATEIQKVGGLQNIQQLAPELLAQTPAYLQNRRSLLTAQLGQAQQQGKPTAGIAQELNETHAALEKVTAAAKRNGNAMGQLGQVFQTFFKYALGYGALYQVIGALGAITRGVIDFESKLAQIRAVAGLTNGEMVQVASSIETVADRYAFSVEQINEATLTLAQAGVEMKDIGSTLDSVAAFATATGTSLQQAADLITSVKDVYEELGAGTIANLLTQAVNISKLTGSDLQTIVGLSAGVAKSFNLSAEQYLAAVATLRNAGLKASTVATGLRQTMLEIFNPDDKLLKVLEERYKSLGEDQTRGGIKARFFGFSQGENGLAVALDELERLGLTGAAKPQFEGAFDIRSRNVIEALARNRGTLAGFEAQLGAGDSTSISAAENLNTVAGALQQVRNESTLLAKSLTEDMLPVLREFLKDVADFAAGLRKLDQELKAGGGSGVSGVLGATVLPAGILGAAQARGGFYAKLGAFAGYGAAAGIGAVGATAGANAAGAGSRTSELVGDIAGLAIPLLLGRIGSKMAGKTAVVDAVAENGSKAVGMFATRLGTLFPLLGRLGALLGGGGPVGLAVAGLLAGYGIYKTVQGRTADQRFDSITGTLSKDASAFSQSRTIERAYSGEGIGQGSELRKLQVEATDLDEQLGAFFSDRADSVEKAKDLLSEIYRGGLDASGDSRQALIEKLNTLADKKLSDEEINKFSRLATEVNEKSLAIVLNAEKDFTRIKQLGDDAAESDKRRAQAFEETFRQTYRNVLDDPEGTGPRERLLAISSYYQRVTELEKEVTIKAKQSLQADFEEASKLFAEAAAENPFGAQDRLNTLIDILGQLNGDVVAGLQVVIDQVEEARSKLKASRDDSIPEFRELFLRLVYGKDQGTRRFAGEQAAKDKALAEVERNAKAEQKRRDEGRERANKQVTEQVQARRLDLEEATKKAATLGVVTPEGTQEVLKQLETAAVLDPESKKVNFDQAINERSQRILAAIQTENLRLETGRKNIKAIDERRAQLAKAERDKAEEEAYKNLGRDTTNLSDTATALGLAPAALNGSIREQLAAAQATGTSGQTAVDKAAALRKAGLERELSIVDRQITSLRAEAAAGDTKAADDAQKLMDGARQSLTDKLKELEADRVSRDAALVQTFAKFLGETQTKLATASLADTKRRFDDAVTAGQLTIENLNSLQAEEQAALIRLEDSYLATLMSQSQYAKDGRLTDQGTAAFEEFRKQQRNYVTGLEGTQGFIKSQRTAYSMADADISDNGLEGKRSVAAIGSDFQERDRALDREQAKRKELVNINALLAQQQEDLAKADVSTPLGKAQFDEINASISLLTKQQHEVVSQLDDLTVKAEELNGSLSEELSQVMDNLSPEAFQERANLGVEKISDGVGSALETAINGIGDALVDATDKSKDFKAAMKSLATEIGDELARMFAREGVKQLFSLLSSGLSFGINALFGSGGGVVGAKDGWSDIRVDKYAAGGTIVGRGNDVSDSIPGYVVDANGLPTREIRVANGESILTGKGTQLLGKRAIDMINKGQMPMVQRAQAASSSTIVSNVNNPYMFQIPVTIEGEDGGSTNSVNTPQLQSALRQAVTTEIERQKRPGGALYKR